MIDARNENVRFEIAQRADGELDAVGRSSFDCIAEEFTVLGKLACPEGIIHGDRVTDRASLLVGCDNGDAADLFQFHHQRKYARGIDPVIVGHEDAKVPSFVLPSSA